MATFDLTKGDYAVDNARIAIVASRFNNDVVQALLTGALDTLKHYELTDSQVTVVRVPGAYEIPLAANRLARTGRFDAIIALGAVVRGETPHFDYVAGECARGVTQTALQQDIPVIFGVLTTDTMDQARARAGGARGNKGNEAALAALEMVTLVRQLDR